MTAKGKSSGYMATTGWGRDFIVEARGFHITFDNGLTVSVQFGTGNYCASRANSDWSMRTSEERDFPNLDVMEADTAEVAVWDEEGTWATYDLWRHFYGEDLCDDVVGWVRPDKLADLMHLVANMPSCFRAKPRHIDGLED